MDLKESAQNVTMHGFARFFMTNNRIMRLIWLLLVLCSTSMLLYQIGAIIIVYTSHPTLMRTSTVIESRLQFPAITICGLQNNDDLVLNGSALPTNPDMEHFSDAFNQSCIMGGASYCSYPRDFKEVLTIDRGLCSTFNPNGTLYQLRSGYYYGLTLVLFLNSSKVKSTSEDETQTIGDGIEVFPHHPDYFPFTLTNSYLASPGFLTRIEMKRVRIKRRPYPYYSNCTDGKNINLVYPGSYTLINCEESCVAREMAKTCSFNEQYRNHHLPKHMQKPIARKEEDTRCVWNAYARLEKAGYESCGCHLPCTEVKYPSVVSYSKWPAVTRLPQLKKSISSALGLNPADVTEEYFNRNFAKISIFYGDLSDEEVSEVPSYTLSNLISNIGGQMGIWIGASVFSILELIYLSMQLARFIYTKKSNKATLPTV